MQPSRNVEHLRITDIDSAITSHLMLRDAENVLEELTLVFDGQEVLAQVEDREVRHGEIPSALSTSATRDGGTRSFGVAAGIPTERTTLQALSAVGEFIGNNRFTGWIFELYPDLPKQPSTSRRVLTECLTVTTRRYHARVLQAIIMRPHAHRYGVSRSSYGGDPMLWACGRALARHALLPSLCSARGTALINQLAHTKEGNMNRSQIMVLLAISISLLIVTPTMTGAPSGLYRLNWYHLAWSRRRELRCASSA